jgi:hypothetical protein
MRHGSSSTNGVLSTFLTTAPRTLSPRALVTLAAIAAAATFACSNKSSVTQPPPSEQASLGISGPDTVSLSCRLLGTAHYVLSERTGPIQTVVWRLDGTQIATGSESDPEFSHLGAYAVHVDGYTADDQKIASADKAVTATVPADLTTCAPASRISGRFGVLIPTNGASASSTYTADLPPALENRVDSFNWTLQQEGGASREIASGRDATTVSIEFGQEGTYSVQLDQVIGATTTSVTKRVDVRRGEAFAEPGTIALYRRFGYAEQPTVYLLDGESGILSEPLLQGSEASSDLSCSSTELVYTTSEQNPVTLEWHSVVDAIGLDGSNKRRIIQRDGDVFSPNIHGNTVVAVDNSRLGFEGTELALLNLDTDEYKYLSGATPSKSYAGNHPAINPSGSLIALGAVHVTLNDTLTFRIVMYGLNGKINGPLHDQSFAELYQNQLAIEGNGGIAWDPQHQYIAYPVLVGGEQSVIMRSSTSGSDDLVLAEGWGPVAWSPSGDHLLYTHINRDLQSSELMQIDRDGSNPVNITRRLLGSDVQVTDVTGGYCFDPGA